MTAAERVRPRLLPLGDCAWTVEFGDTIDAALNERVLGLAAVVKGETVAGRLTGVVECVPTFRSLTVHYDPLAVRGEALAEALARLAADAGTRAAHGRRWRLPVLFGGEHGPDLDELAAAKGLAPERVVELLTATVFRVYMIGFMPGFPYLGGLPAELAMPRLASPRTAVPERSLAVAGEMCAVYPWRSPGGWRLLGRTPVRLFDAADTEAPTLLAPGDQVMWQAIDADAYAEMDERAARGALARAEFLVTEAAAWPR